MKRVGFKMKLKYDYQEEYKKRHDQIWPEMLEMLDRAGIKNYSIWNIGQDLFGYYEVEDLEYSEQLQNKSALVAKWNEHMQDILESKADDKNRIFPLKEAMELMFYKE